MDRKAVNELVEREIGKISDPSVLDILNKLRVDPYPVERDWNYGLPGQRYICWTFLEHLPSNTGIAYCAAGFGPEYPWGLVFLSGPYMSMGMSDAWYPALEQAIRESMAWEDPAPPTGRIT